MRYTVLVVGFMALAAACGPSSGGPGASPQALNALAQDVSSAAASYGTQASGMTSAPGCTADESQYDATVRPKVGQMQSMGPTMDQDMGAMGHPADADMTCAADAMMAELDHHHDVACASATDMGPNITEAHRHVTAMTHWADHQLTRSSDLGSMMGGGMGGGGMGGGGMMTGGGATGHCVHNQDGTYSLQ